MVAVSLFISLFFLWGGGYNTAPIFLPALLKAFGWSHGRVSWITGGLSLAIGVSAPIAGWLLDRVEARFVMGAGAILAVLGLLSASRSNSFESLLLSVLLLGFGLGASTWLAASTVIANWFPDRRGFALGIVTAGMEAGGMTFIVGSVIAAYGWRAGYFTVAIPELLIVVPLLVVFIRTRGRRKFRANLRLISRSQSVLPGFEVREAVRTRAFRMLVVAQLAYGLAVGGTFHHLVAFLEGLGYNLHSATLVVSIVLGLAAVGKAAMGALGDRIGGKNALALGFVMIAAGVFILLDASHVSILALWLVVVGIAGAAPVALVPMVTAETLGLRRFGTLFGWLGTVVTIGLFLGPLLVGWLTDLTGSYEQPFELCALIALVGSAAAFICKVPASATAPLLVQEGSSSAAV